MSNFKEKNNIKFYFIIRILGVIILIIGTTPTFTLSIKNKNNLNLYNAKKIYFTIRQGSLKMTKTDNDITIKNEYTVQISFTQEETIQFRYNIPTDIQLNWTYANGERAATKIKTIQLSRNLIREVLE